MKRYSSLIENLVVGVFVLLSLELIIFPGLSSHNILVNMISLISFCILIIVSLASVSIGDKDS